MLDTLISLVSKAAPLLATALGGPAAGAAVSMISSAFGVDTKDTQQLIDKIRLDPASQLKLAEIQATHVVQLQQLEIERLKIDSSERLAQISVAKADAESEDKYQARWRPTVGYICCAALSWTFVLQPLATFSIVAFGIQRHFPMLPTSDLLTLLGGMLGFGYLRSYDKKVKKG